MDTARPLLNVKVWPNFGVAAASFVAFGVAAAEEGLLSLTVPFELLAGDVEHPARRPIARTAGTARNAAERMRVPFGKL
ncbi:hypothetical protein E9228_002970 [Curtobacterium flaccumfaciens]|uniref:Uncharacterized protein n=1 Tax=Curtobacterium salicis TaxID=1779862 RepID=A0ABX0TB54_9MICO|nr:hypothetical protein [Curtobacterium sp. WW7]NII42312.1 hypothetical protein [Curtobacterium sp. WW7]